MKEIQEMRDLFYRAHSATSYSPEKRAESCVSDFSKELEADLAELENSGNYKEKYLAHLRTWAGRKSRTMSSMITGPANFPVERNRKAMNAEQRSWEEFRNWRARYIKRANAVRTPSPEDDLQDALDKLEKAKYYHARMVGINKVLRSKKSIEKQNQELREEFNLDEPNIGKIRTPDCFGRIGFASYSLQNDNARIKSLEQKVLTMKTRIAVKDVFEEIQFQGGRIGIENDRVVIYHERKPDAFVIGTLKEHGFRWSPNYGCWCRKHTANALHIAKQICKTEVA